MRTDIEKSLAKKWKNKSLSNELFGFMNMQTITKRYNTILHYLWEYLMQHTGYHIRCDVTSDDIDNLLRVDL